jgi:hypothetical protein
MYLETKPDYDQCVERVLAWFDAEIIDRAPVRFHRHNAEYDNIIGNSGHASLRERWMDGEFQALSFLNSVKGKTFIGETFPVYMPNLGPNFFAAVHGAELVFGEVTSWCEPIVNDHADIEKIRFSKVNPYYKSMHELTQVALEVCKGQFLVGYTDIHHGMDCAAAWRGSENLCMDMLLDEQLVIQLLQLASEHFLEVYDEFDALLKAHGQPSVTWINLPVPNGRMHVPINDFAFMISPELFNKFALKTLKNEMKTMTHNVFHIDGKGVANHTDAILSAGISAIQWVQGMADDYPVMQHIPYIKYLQSKGASVIVDLDLSDLEAFMKEVSPKGIFLWIATSNRDQEIQVLNKLLKWK